MHMSHYTMHMLSQTQNGHTMRTRHVLLLKPHKVNDTWQPLPPPILENDIDMLLEGEHVQY
jgi:hypothetical protein